MEDEMTTTTTRYVLSGLHLDKNGYRRDSVGRTYEVLVVGGRAYQEVLYGCVPEEFAVATLDEFGYLPAGAAGCYFLPDAGEIDRVGRQFFAPER